ncbi:hypothetical protein TNCV_4784611 [Trichonephila clavipes]|nr:hypothetical protein TNCV_4784611 [Trichonephila clavipes]
MCCLALQEIFHSSWTDYRLLMCRPAGAPNILRSVDTSAISSGRDTHMIAEHSSRDGTFFFFLLRVVIIFCAVYLREGRSDGRPERIIQQTSKFQSQFFGIRFTFPSSDSEIPSTRVYQKVPAPGGH